MCHLVRSTVLGTLVLAGLASTGYPLAADDGNAPKMSRVRGFDALSRQLLETAATWSPTVAGMVAELEQSDIIVVVTAGRLPSGLNGVTQLVAAQPTVRYVRVVLRFDKTVGMLEALGHELRHAVEIAGMLHVRDGSSFVAAYRTIGRESADGVHETRAAVETGRQVAREVWRYKGQRR